MMVEGINMMDII